MLRFLVPYFTAKKNAYSFSKSNGKNFKSITVEVFLDNNKHFRTTHRNRYKIDQAIRWINMFLTFKNENIITQQTNAAFVSRLKTIPDGLT